MKEYQLPKGCVIAIFAMFVIVAVPAFAFTISHTIQDRDYGFAITLCPISAGPATVLVAIATVFTVFSIIIKKVSFHTVLDDLYHAMWCQYRHHFIIAAVGLTIFVAGLILAALRIP